MPQLGNSNPGLRRALEKCRSALMDPEAVPGRYPMYVVSFEDFMNMKSVQPHHELKSAGIVVEYEPEMGDAIFVSHQWVGFSHPDINFHQMQVLQTALDRLVGAQVPLKSSIISYVFFGHGNHIDASRWRRDFLFIWYDYFSCPQLVARSDTQADSAELKAAVDSIGYYVQVSKHFVVLAPFVEHAETGKLLSRESWRSRGWCRFERVCREFLCDNPNIAVIESPKHCYVMTPLDSWLRPAAMGHFTVESDRDKVHRLVSGMLHTKLVSCLESSDLHTYRLVLNLRHMYLRKTLENAMAPVHSDARRELTTESESKLVFFLKENGFENVRDRQFGWSPACLAALRGDAQVLKEILAARVNVNDRVKTNELNYHIYKGMSLLLISAQFGNNVAVRLLVAEKADLHAKCSLGTTALHHVGIGNNTEAIPILLEAGFNAHILDGFGGNAVHPALCWGNRQFVEALLHHVPTIDISNTVLDSCVGEGEPEELLPVLLEAGADINQKLKLKNSLRLQLELLARLAKMFDRRRGSNVFFFVTNMMESTPLICSLMTRSFHGTAIIIAAGADTTLKNARGRTAMEMAELVEAPEFILEGLRGNREECEKHLPPCMAEKLWISV